MNVQPQPRTDAMFLHAHPVCALSALYRLCLRLFPRLGNVPKPICCHQHVTQEPSAHPNLWHTGHHKQLKPIQLP